MVKTSSDSYNNPAKLQSIIESQNKEITSLREEVFKYKDELHTMRNSRVLGKVIKIHKTIGDPKTLVLRSINKVRRKAAPLVPDNIRLPLMRNLRHIRDNFRQRGHTNGRVEVVDNELWDVNLPLVSIIIPYYNRADTIDETLGSLIGQTFQNFEVIIVNDGSPDTQSIDKLKEIVANYPDTKVIHQKNQGVSQARNTGIREARGKYIVCLDSDDLLMTTFVEKAVTVLETNPDVSIVSSYMSMFGVINKEFEHTYFDPIKLYIDNMLITAAMFTKKAWKVAGGYKSDIGYEDWEFWLNLTEHGFLAYQIPESLFKYRTAMQSRYVDDKDVHWNNLKNIHKLHPNYRRILKNQLRLTNKVRHVVSESTALINLGVQTTKQSKRKHNILITIPWMTFGGAETLIYNFCREIKDDYNITFVTGVFSKNEWEYKFREVTDSIYHLPNILPRDDLYGDYLERIIEEKNIDIIHVIHNGFTFDLLPTIKKDFPRLRVILTLFNDKAAYFDQSLSYLSYVDTITSDNKAVVDHYKRVTNFSSLQVIPNGIDCYDKFSPQSYDEKSIRNELKADGVVTVFFVGRLSEEKNPDVFIESAINTLADKEVSKLVKFYVIGDGPMRARVEKQIRNADTDRIVYLGYQANIGHYLSAADIFVLPSSIEGFPLSILEAMSMGVATVASRVGAIPDIIKSGTDGVIVSPGDDGDISRSLKKLIINNEFRNKIKTNARKVVMAKYSSKKLGENYRKLYDNIKESKNGR